MSKVYIFDVDGTLTPSRQKMTPDFEEFFYEWSKGKKYYLVSGSDLPKMREQMGYLYLDRAQGLFTCGGNKFYVKDKLEYDRKFDPPITLLKYLREILINSKYRLRTGNHIEDRGSMLNFSVIGRDCNLPQRKNYFEWDNKNKEREKIAKYINERWDYLQAVIGGQISIDISQEGCDKSQVIGVIKEIESEATNFVFIGDRTMEGGNDYPLAKVMKEMDDCEVYQAGEPSAEDGYKRTQEILESLND